MNGQIEKAMRKRRYPGLLPEDDIPRWKIVLIEGVVTVFIVVFMLAWIYGVILLTRVDYPALIQGLIT